MLATIDQINAAFLPKLLIQEYNSANEYSHIPGAFMKSLGIQLIFEAASFDDEQGVMETWLTLSWNQDLQGNFVLYNAEAKDAKVQRNVRMKVLTELPYSWFTEDQLAKFKARSESAEYVKWVADNAAAKAADAKSSVQFPRELNVWTEHDIYFVYTSTNSRSSYSNGLGFELVAAPGWDGFKAARFQGSGFSQGKTPAAKPRLATQVYDVTKSVWGAPVQPAQQIVVTAEMKAAAIPKPPSLPAALQQTPAPAVAPAQDLPFVPDLPTPAVGQPANQIPAAAAKPEVSSVLAHLASLPESERLKYITSLPADQIAALGAL